MRVLAFEDHYDIEAMLTAGGVDVDRFEFHDTYCVLPASLVLAYSLAVVKSGDASHIYMAGFDGYNSGDPRNDEVELMFSLFSSSASALSFSSITPTFYKNLPCISVYALLSSIDQ